MRIGIASEWIGEDVGGLERYAAKLTRELIRVDPDNSYSLFVTPRASHTFSDIADRRVTVHATGHNSRWHYVPLGLPLSVARHPVDVLHATFSIAPWCPGKRVIYTLHDVCADVHPEFFPPLIRRRVRWLTSVGIARARYVVVPTEATRTEVLQHYPGAKDKLRVVPLGFSRSPRGPDSSALGLSHETATRLPEEFILYVGRFHARKNLERLVEAFAILRRRGERRTRLILVGRDLWSSDRVMTRVNQLGLDDEVLCPGHVSDAELELFYRRAKVFAFPSLHEGFGMPPLEAMDRGVPVMGSSVSAMPEILGDAAVLVDPYSPEAMADALARLLRDPALREECIRRGRQRTARYGWERTARATLELYEAAARGAA